jgi:disulfide oxidoreductase YuzD
VSKSKAQKIQWLADVAEPNYPAAESYLLLLYPAERVAELLGRLRAAPVTRFKAKDIFRASGLSLLGVSNSHVERDWEKIREGGTLSPLLLVRDEARGRVVVADGYHRMCAVYRLDEDAEIPCRIV